MSMNAAHIEPTIFIVADDAASRTALVEMQLAEGRRAQTFEGMREFISGLDDVDRQQVGCAVIDLRLAMVEGLEIHERLVERGFSLPTIIIAADATTAATVKLVREGVLALVDKPHSSDDLAPYVQEALAKSEEDNARQRYQAELESRFKRLSPQDRQVLQLILEGSKNRTMAARLNVSLRTVENRRRRVFDVMQAESVAQLTRQVMEYEHHLPRPAGTAEAWMALPFERVA